MAFKRMHAENKRTRIMSDTSVKSTGSSLESHSSVPVAERAVEPAPVVPAQRESVSTARKGLPELVKYVASALILALGVGIFLGLGQLKEKPKEKDPGELIPIVATDTAEPYVGQLDMVVSGTVVPFREIRVAAEVSGNVIKKYPACEAGNFVRKDDKLIEIDPKDYELQVATRKAELNQAKRMLAETEQEVDGAEKNLALAERDFLIAQDEFSRNSRIKGALSSAEFDQSKRNLLNVETALTNRKNLLNLINARLERMQSAIELSKNQLERAELNLKKTTILAPDDGVIVFESVQEGEFVNLGAQLLTFEDTSRSEVICNLSQRDIDWIRDNSPLDPEAAQKIAENKVLAVYYLPKTSVAIFEPEKESIVWQGVLERFDGIGRDNRTRTVPTRITISDPLVEIDGKPHALVRGMYVKCRIQVQVSEASEDQKFISFPSSALRAGNFVWTVTPENTLKKVPVVIIDRTEKTVNGKIEELTIIRLTKDSLQPDDPLVVGPIPQPAEEMPVQLQSDIEKSESAAEASKDQPSEKSAQAADSKSA